MKKFTAAFLVTALVLIVLIKSDKEIKNLISPSPDETAESYLTLISTGDIGLVRDVNYKIIQAKDPSYPFLKIADYLKDGDLTVGNLEGPLIDNCPIIREGFTFCGQSSNASGLTYAGIDAMNLANNHSTNFGLSGLEESEKILRSNGIVPFGSDKNIEYLKIRDKKIALIGFVELGNSWGGLNNATGENVSELVRTARQNADIVITSFHWGIEYTRKPTENQVALAHLAIDSGADIVLGNHPHWIQTTEVYKGKFISYAQGNTVFDQDWSQETKEGVLYKFVYRNGVFEKIGEKYTIIEDNVQPRFATEEEILKIKQKITQ
ncbi:MAG: CapA family protein [Candidatus Levybacteria bacterium]|nr:CapA family protein [Candidatus Levybacteria bacterium]